MDRYAETRAALFSTVLDGPASLDRATRAAIAANTNVPAPLATLVAKIHRHAYRVTDEDVREALSHGYTEDQLFEVMVSAAVGASRQRYEAAARAMSATAATESAAHDAKESEHATASR